MSQGTIRPTTFMSAFVHQQTLALVHFSSSLSLSTIDIEVLRIQLSAKRLATWLADFADLATKQSKTLTVTGRSEDR